ncbi:CHAD domain-containing protein [Yoonia vestfoldensis]|jgi:CHAD domain-containing protein|uniref:CHAD domain-containing protein n=1 Tax=Yoonia vestfoldensis TaxID=245188 RepID=UPI00037A3294|nr:CHAD domain-containing protein [Yoonia vestfoldensis]
MTHSNDASYSLPLAAAEGLAQEDFGKFTATWMPEGDDSDLTVLDCFDLPLLRSGRLLLEIRNTLDLLTADGQILTQTAQRGGNFVTDLPDGPVKRALGDLSVLRSLLPVGTGKIRRETLTLRDDEDKVQCRAQLRQLITADGGALLVFVQGLRGYEKARALMHSKIEAAGGKTFDDDDLFARLFPGRVAYQAKPEIVIASDEAAFDIANDIIAAHILVARANEPGIIADHDTEFLHDYRIALRKIRSVLSLFKGIYEPDQTEDLKARFSSLMAATGRLRDLDVYLMEKQKYYALLPVALHGGLDMLFNRLSADRKEEHAKLAARLRSKSYAKEIEKLERLFTRRKKLSRGPKADLSAHGYASTLIWKRYDKVHKIAAEIGPNTDDTEIHALRIHCKKLRYLMEFFAPAFPQSQVKSLIKPLRHLQDTLGLFNDYAIQQVSLAAILHQLDERPESGALELAQSIGALVAMLHRLQIEERAKVMDGVARFDRAETRQRFRSLFREGH